MSLKVAWEQNALAELDELDSSVRNQVLEKIDRYSHNFTLLKPMALKGKLKGYYKLVVGKDYRVIYSIERQNKAIVIESVGHRSKVYKHR